MSQTFDGKFCLHRSISVVAPCAFTTIVCRVHFKPGMQNLYHGDTFCTLLWGPSFSVWIDCLDYIISVNVLWSVLDGVIGRPYSSATSNIRGHRDPYGLKLFLRLISLGWQGGPPHPPLRAPPTKPPIPSPCSQTPLPPPPPPEYLPTFPQIEDSL